MLSSITPARFLPRSHEATVAARRQAALRALVAELAANLETVQKEQAVQFRRIAQIQQDIDEIKNLLKGPRKRTRKD